MKYLAECQAHREWSVQETSAIKNSHYKIAFFCRSLEVSYPVILFQCNIITTEVQK